MNELRFARTVPITWGATSIELPIVRLVATRKSSAPLVRGHETPGALVASESVEVTVRCNLGDFPELLSGTWGDRVPHAWLRFPPHTVDALAKFTEQEPSYRGLTHLLTFLLLRVPVSAIWFDESEWAKDEELSYSRDGVQVTVVKPKPRLDAEVYVGEPGTGGWEHVGAAQDLRIEP